MHHRVVKDAYRLLKHASLHGLPLRLLTRD